MDFGWSQEQLEFRELVREFGSRVLSVDATDRDETAEFDHALWQECANFGIQGLPVPEEFGGSGADAVKTMLAMEALGYGCRDHGLLFSIHAHMWAVETPLITFGTEAQKQRYLPGLCDGSLIGAHAMSEPDSGSDAFALRTRAEQKGDRYVLTGTKTFCTNAPISDLLVTFATVNPKLGMWGVTAFLVERDSPGLTIGNKIKKMGLTTSPMAEVVFDACEVPAENLLGSVGQGAIIFNHSMGWERSCILASDVGAMERQLEKCVQYGKDRRQFGKPIGNFQLIAAKIADMKVRLETSRLLLYRTAWMQAGDGMTALDAAITKLYISEAAVQSGLDAVQIHGGYGYTREFEVERELRNVIGGTLYSGTSEIQRLIIARNLGLAP